MSRIIFAFISSFFILLAFFSGGINFSLEDQLSICLVLIALFGIPHGAIDNELYLRQNRISSRAFYLYYLSIIGLNVILWILLPWLASLIFLIVSAYHFGQSQFSHYEIKSFLRFSLYYLWGQALITGMLLFNLDGISELVNEFEGFTQLQFLSSYSIISFLFYSSLIVTAGILIYLTLFKEFDFEKLILETFVFSIIIFSFYVFPLLIGFTLYFIILHAFKVMIEEYSFLRTSEGEGFGIIEFIKQLLPFTLLASVGTAILFVMSEYDFIGEMSFGYLFLILISSITLPHAVVMEKFYRKFKLLS